MKKMKKVTLSLLFRSFFIFFFNLLSLFRCSFSVVPWLRLNASVTFVFFLCILVAMLSLFLLIVFLLQLKFSFATKGFGVDQLAFLKPKKNQKEFSETRDFTFWLILCNIWRGVRVSWEDKPTIEKIPASFSELERGLTEGERT